MICRTRPLVPSPLPLLLSCFAPRSLSSAGYRPCMKWSRQGRSPEAISKHCLGSGVGLCWLGAWSICKFSIVPKLSKRNGFVSSKVVFLESFPQPEDNFLTRLSVMAAPTSAPTTEHRRQIFNTWEAGQERVLLLACGGHEAEPQLCTRNTADSFATVPEG